MTKLFTLVAVGMVLAQMAFVNDSYAQVSTSESTISQASAQKLPGYPGSNHRNLPGKNMSYIVDKDGKYLALNCAPPRHSCCSPTDCGYCCNPGEH